MLMKINYFAILALLVAVGCNPLQQTSSISDNAITVPFRGNSYVTACKGDVITTSPDIIDTWTGELLSWNDSDVKLAFFLKTDKCGSLDININACCPQGTEKSVLKFTCGGKTESVTISGNSTQLYHVGEFMVSAPGYVRVDIEGKARKGEGGIARIESYVLDGEAICGNLNYITEADVDDSYWYRRGPSVHFNYTLPEEDVEWFYSEVTVPEGMDVPDTYFMLTGFGEGYMGIQTHHDGPNSLLFSVWSPFETDNPEDVPEEDKIVVLRKGEGVTAQAFGDEGSGGQSFKSFDWEAGKTYRTLVHVRPAGNGSTDYTGYFGDDQGNWHLLASFRRPKTDTWYKKAHSFLECFVPETSIHTRGVAFKNQWAVLRDGSMVEITEATFTCDNTGRKGVRADMFGAVRDGGFYLQNCGFINDKTEYRTKFNRPAGGSAPVIDFDALERL